MRVGSMGRDGSSSNFGVWRAALLVFSVLFVFGGSLADPAFTGNASLDFSEPGVFRFDDPGGKDVGLPPAFPEEATSGWDVKALYFYYNRTSDIIQVGIDFYGIAGDADGDRDAGHTGTILESQGGIDEPDLGGTESIVLLLDTNLDKKYELAIGVNGTANISSFGTYSFIGNKYAPGFGFGKRLSSDPTTLYANPSPSMPDIEFAIARFSNLPGFSFSPGEPFSFRTTLFSGSLADYGIGDDLVPGPDGTLITFSSSDKGSDASGSPKGDAITTETGKKDSGVQL